jgi:beta-lactamase regulating signal transducer with metallopeptidase domain
MYLLRMLAEPWWRQLLVMLLHTLWQASLVALGLAWCLRRIPVQRADARYMACVSAMVAVVVGALVTWSVERRAEGRLVPGAGRIPVVTDPGPAPADPSEPPVDRGVAAVAEGVAAAPAGSGALPGWIPLLAACWLIGVMLMLVRAVVDVGAACRLRRRAKPLDDPVISGAVRQLCGRLRVRRRVRIAVTDVLTGPAVAGVFWPTLLIPASLVTGMPPEAWLAILAHELAHIRRYDALVAIGQLLVETTLFFNPAVWWISRQIRIEREACCDRVAAGMTGEPSGYVRVLADWADRLLQVDIPAVAPAFAGTNRGTLLDRASRLLLPGYRPAIPITWSTFAGGLLVGAVLLAGLWRGTAAAVALAAEVLNPSAQLRQLEEAGREYAPGAAQASSERTAYGRIEGTITTGDGRPLPGTVDLITYSTNAHSSSSNSHGRAQDHFSLKVPAGSVLVRATAEGYAPTVIGPLPLKPDATITGVRIVLDPGLRASVRLVDEGGKPVVEGELLGGMRMGGMNPIDHWNAAEDGVVRLEHAGRGVYSLEARASGFESAKREIRFTPGEAVTWTLRRARPTSGVIVDAAGSPVAEAPIKLFAEYSAAKTEEYPAWHGRDLGSTDPQGRFTLRDLRRGLRYALLIRAEDGDHLLRDVPAGEPDLKLRLDPEFIIRGTIRGDMERLQRSKGRGVIEYSTTVTILNEGYGSSSTSVPVDVEHGVGRFEIRGLLPGRCHLRAADQSLEVEIGRKPVEELVIDLDRGPARRTVAIELRMPAGVPPPTGLISYYSSLDKGPCSPLAGEVKLENGRAECPGYVGGRFSCTPRWLVGGVFKDVSVAALEPGKTPYIIPVTVAPAGAIVGRVLGSDGKPVGSSMSVSVQSIRPPPGSTSIWSLHNVEVEAAEGTFMATPIPFGGTYAVRASLNKNLVFSEPVVIDAAHPLQKMELRLGRGVTGVVRVMDPQGRPAEGIPVEFSFESPAGGTTYSPPMTTDADGYVRIADLNPDPRIRYIIGVPARQRYQAVRSVPLDLAHLPLVLNLRPGLGLSGRLIDSNGGRPVADAEIAALYQGSVESLRWRRFEAEARTDAEGRFRFSNLVPGEYTFFINAWKSGRTIRADGVDRRATAGQAEPVELRIGITDLK